MANEVSSQVNRFPAPAYDVMCVCMGQNLGSTAPTTNISQLNTQAANMGFNNILSPGAMG
jgi:hypothetical protein